MKSNSENDVDLTTNIAAMLREVSEQCHPGIKKIIDKTNKAARQGKNSITIKCEEADHKCLNQFSWENRPPTTLVKQLKEYGFHLSSEYDIGMFSSGWKLTIAW